MFSDFSYLQDLLDSAIAAARVDRGGAVHVLVESQQKFYLAAHAGFPSFLAASLPPDPSDQSTAIGRATSTRQRVVIQDIEHEDWYASHRGTARSAGYRSLNATPLISPRRKVLGVLTVLYEKPRRPSTLELQVIDTYARMATMVIEAGRLKAAIIRAEAPVTRTVSDIELKAAIRRLRSHPYNSALVEEICKLGDQYVNDMWVEFERIAGQPAGQ